MSYKQQLDKWLDEVEETTREPARKSLPVLEIICVAVLITAGALAVMWIIRSIGWHYVYLR